MSESGFDCNALFGIKSLINKSIRSTSPRLLSGITTHQSLCEEIHRHRARVGEQLRERAPFAEGQRAYVVPRSPRRDRVELVERRCAKHVEDQCELMVVVTSREQRLSGEHFREDATNRPDVDGLYERHTAESASSF